MLSEPGDSRGARALFWHYVRRTPSLAVESLRTVAGIIELAATALLLAHTSVTAIGEFWQELSPWWSLLPFGAFLLQGWFRESHRLIEAQRKRANDAEEQLAAFTPTREQENKLVLFLEEGNSLNRRKVTSDEELAQLTLDCNDWYGRTIEFLNTAFSPAKAALFRNGKLMVIEWSGGFNKDHNQLTKSIHMRLEVLKGFIV